MSDPTAAEIVAALASGGIASQLRTLAYFAIFGTSLVTIVVRFPYRAAFARLVGHPPVRARLILLALPYAAFALYHTWRLILRFFVAHTQKYAYHPDPPNLFVEAYVEVSDSAVGWWWSQTLLCWVVAACPLAQRAAAQRGLGPWLVLAHVVAAFAGAVSLGFPLLFAQLLLAPPPPPHPHPPGRAAPRHVAPWVWPACSLVSLASVLAVRASVGGPRVVFIAALAAVHVLLVAPFALACRAPPPPAGRPVLPPPPSRAAFLFFVLGLLCWAAHIHASGELRAEGRLGRSRASEEGVGVPSAHPEPRRGSAPRVTPTAPAKRGLRQILPPSRWSRRCRARVAGSLGRSCE